MFYRQNENGDWDNARKIKLAITGEVLDENNKENSHGWEWHDNPPQEYLDWLKEQNQNDDEEE